ncbi:hypothetical protein S40288_03569 [Stachybotrys chartarum IBT 40288]|nr:hypothetical protein S40288_03569 [Stachybotrys chartarum IBT 40288]
MYNSLQVTTLIALTAGAFARDIYVSPTGTGVGTIDAPYGSIQSAVDAAAAGDTIHLRGGTYRPSRNIQVGKSGTRTSPITVRSYGSERVIVDGENMPGTPYGLDQSLPNAERGIFHIQNAQYWKFYNLELINGPYGIYARDASHNYYERLSTHDNYETGFQLEGASQNNTVIYLDSYANRDPRKNGESADGFACKSGSGAGNVLRNARLWDNVDDGLDLFMFASPVTIEEVYAWGNGYNRWGFSPFEGDGNGFKLGITDNPPANHVIRNSIAFNNLKKGFIDNGNPGSLTFERNTAWNNGDNGFNMRSSTSTLRANIAVLNVVSAQVSLVSGTTATGNSWNSGGSWSNSSFVSVNYNTLRGPRGADGRVAASDFLIPASGAAIGATTRSSVHSFSLKAPSMPRTLLAFQRNGHLATLQAAVTAVRQVASLEEADRGLFKQAQDDDHVVVTDATVFHPQGGGQPSDVGVMEAESGPTFNVHMVRMAATKQDEVLHFGRFADTSAVFQPGQIVTQTIDQEKRLLYSRYHTAGHVLGSAVRHLLEKQVEGFDETKASHFPDSAACEFLGLIEGKWKDAIQEKLDAYIAKDMPVEIDWWDEADFKSNGLERLIPDRKAMGMADDEKFRVVKIIGAEAYPCGGTHVDSTQLCGKTVVKKISRSKGTSRVSYNLP